MKLFDLLIESRVDFLKDKYVPIIRDKYNQKSHSAEMIFDDIKLTDPTNNKIYLQWLLRSAINLNKELFNRFVIEDLDKYEQYLTIYDKIKQRLPLEQRDINKLSFDQLKNIALQYKQKEEEILTKNDYLDKKYKINETNEYLVYMFKTRTEKDFKMYQLVSTNTEWCTRPNYDTFKEYIDESPLFIFINKNNRSEKYQFHEQSNQFMDFADKKISYELIIKLIPLIKNYLKEDFALIINIDNSYGFINKDGNIIAKGFKNTYPFSDGLAWVVFNDNSFGFINKDGKIISKGFKNANSFYEGLARVQFNDGSWGFINKDGKVIVKGFKSIWSSKNGFTKVKFNDNFWGYLSKDLKLYYTYKKTLIPKNHPLLKGIYLFPENL